MLISSGIFEIFIMARIKSLNFNLQTFLFAAV